MATIDIKVTSSSILFALKGFRKFKFQFMWSAVVNAVNVVIASHRLFATGVCTDMNRIKPATMIKYFYTIRYESEQ